MKTVSKRKITLCLLMSLIVTTGLEAQNQSFVLANDSTHNIGGSTVVIDQKRMNRGLMTNSLQALTGQAGGRLECADIGCQSNGDVEQRASAWYNLFDRW